MERPGCSRPGPTSRPRFGTSAAIRRNRNLSAKALEGHYAAIRQAVFSRDASQIVTVGDDNRAVVWEFNEKEGEFKDNPVAFERHSSPVLAAAIYSSSEKPRDVRVVTADEDGQMLVWNPALLKKGERGKAALLPAELEGHDKAVHVLAFSSDGKYVLSGSDDNTVKLQPVIEGPEQRRLEDVRTFPRSRRMGPRRVPSVRWRPASRISINPAFRSITGSSSRARMTARSSAGTFRLIRKSGCSMTRFSPRSTAADRDVLSAVFSPDGKTVLTGGRDHKGYLWNVGTGEKLTTSIAPTGRG